MNAGHSTSSIANADENRLVGGDLALGEQLSPVNAPTDAAKMPNSEKVSSAMNTQALGC